MEGKAPTITELISDGLDDDGFRSEDAVAFAMADASPKLVAGCKAAIKFLGTLPASPDITSLINQLSAAVDDATIPAVRNAH